jgi:hypothetical protein
MVEGKSVVGDLVEAVVEQRHHLQGAFAAQHLLHQALHHGHLQRLGHRTGQNLVDDGFAEVEGGHAGVTGCVVLAKFQNFLDADFDEALEGGLDLGLVPVDGWVAFGEDEEDGIFGLEGNE